MDRPDLRVSGLTLGYGRRHVISGLDMAVPPGRFTAILGPNGCGKSTLLRGLAGLHAPREGLVTLDGRPLHRIGAKARAREISMLEQSDTLPEGLTVTDLVRQGRYPHRRLLGGWSACDALAVEEAMAMTGMAELGPRPLSELSGGQRQRARIAMTLAQEARVLLLDEPTTFLDPAHQLDILALILRLVAERGSTVVAVLHDLTLAARVADHVVILSGGRLVAAGPPAAVMTPTVLSQVFAIDVAMLEDPDTRAPVILPRLPARKTDKA